jgi:hypothetical protein
VAEDWWEFDTNSSAGRFDKFREADTETFRTYYVLSQVGEESEAINKDHNTVPDLRAGELVELESVERPV